MKVDVLYLIDNSSNLVVDWVLSQPDPKTAGSARARVGYCGDLSRFDPL